MIRVVDFSYTQDFSKYILLLYVSDLLAYVSIEIDRHKDIHKMIEYYKDLKNINK